MKKCFGSVLRVVLFVSFKYLDSNINLDHWVGPTHEAALVVKIFCWGLIGILSTTILLPIIRLLRKKKNKIWQYIYEIVTFPEEYFWISLLLIIFQVNNINPIVKTQLFQASVFIIAEIVRSVFVNKLIGYNFKDFDQKRIQKNAEEFFSLFIVIFFVVLIFIKR